MAHVESAVRRSRRSKMVISEIWSLYREEWNAAREQWYLKKIEFVFEDPEFPVPSDTPPKQSQNRQI